MSSMPTTTEPTTSLIDIHIHTIITTIQTAIDITNLVCASIDFWYFNTTQIVTFFILRDCGTIRCCTKHRERDARRPQAAVPQLGLGMA